MTEQLLVSYVLSIQAYLNEIYTCGKSGEQHTILESQQNQKSQKTRRASNTVMRSVAGEQKYSQKSPKSQREVATTPAPPPCYDNRTSLYDLHEECGPHSELHICNISNAACANTAFDGDWKCRCTQGYVRSGDICILVPDKLFLRPEGSFTIPLDADNSVDVQEVTTMNVSSYEQAEIFNYSCSTTQPGIFFCNSDTDQIALFINTTQALLIETSYVTFKVIVTAMVETNLVQDEFTINVYLTKPPVRLFSVISDNTFPGHFVTRLPLAATFPLYTNSSHFSINQQGEVTLSSSGENLIPPDSLSNTSIISVSENRSSKIEEVAILEIMVYRESYDVVIPENTIPTLVKAAPTNNVLFRINQNEEFVTRADSEIKLDRSLDYENETTRNFTFSVEFLKNETNSTRVARSEVKLRVNDENDNEPHFPHSRVTVRIAGSALAVFVMNLRAIDEDSAGVLTYSIPAHYSEFEVRNNNTLWMKSAVNSSVVEVVVTDSVYQDTMIVSVEVVNAEGDQDLRKVFNASLSEELPVGTHVTWVNTSGYEDYRFEEKATRYFNINNDTGEVTTAVQIDRDNDTNITSAYNVLSFKVLASSKDIPCLSVILGRVVVTILDKNDNAPVPNRQTYRGNIKEGSSNGTFVKFTSAIRITDRDLHTTLTYNLTHSLFSVGTKSDGTFLLRSTSVLDREALPSSDINIPITIFDGVHRVNVSVNVTVDDVNDNAPVYRNTTHTFRIPEGTATGSEIASLHFTDADAGDNGKINYHVDGGFFKLNDQGKLILDVPLDRETEAEHNITVKACDKGSPPNCIRKEFHIIVEDINDNAPEFQPMDSVLKVNEAATCGESSPITRVNFTDRDVGENGRLSYNVTEGQRFFNVVESTGQIFCHSPLDYEESVRLAVTVKSCDHGAQQKCSKGTVYIIIEDSNDNAPRFVGQYEAGYVSINISRDDFSQATPVSLVSATDRDTGVNAELSFAFENPNTDGASFLTINVDNGFISTKEITDPNNRPTADPNVKHNITIFVNDKGDPQMTSTATLAYTVIASTDNFKFNSTTFNTSMYENATVGSQLLDMSQHLLNPNSVQVSYEIPGASVSNFSKFTINSATGAITLKEALDREEEDVHIFAVKAFSTSSSALALVTAHVKDVNDNPPIFIQSSTVLLFYESETSGSVVGAVTATDTDAGENAVPIYSISPASEDNEISWCSNHMNINETNGQIILTSPVDYDELHNSNHSTACYITVKVQDKGNAELKDFRNLTIEVLDVNDNAPEFVGEDSTVTVQEDIGQAVEIQLPFQATDKDKRQSQNGDFDVSISQETDCDFNVLGRKISEAGNSKTIFFTLKENQQLDYETQRNHTCNVTITDKGNPPKSSTREVMVMVDDVNDNPPIVSEEEYSLTISRFSEPGTEILAEINATDKDDGVNAEIIFKINEDLSALDAWNYFALDDVTGRVLVNASMTSLQLDTVSLVVNVLDKGEFPLSSTAQIWVTLEDDNRRPYFETHQKIVYLTEETRYEDTPIYTPSILARDQTGRDETSSQCQCLYMLKHTAHSGNFEIDNKTALIKLKDTETLDREATPVISLLVIGQDDGEPPEVTHQPLNVTVIVLDVNDQAPVFNSSLFEGRIFQEYPVNKTIMTISAQDADDKPQTRYDVISFNVSNNVRENFTSVMVNVNPTSGEIYLNESVDLKSLEEFEISVIVQAIDVQRQDFSDETGVRIYVTPDDPNEHSPQFVGAPYLVTANLDNLKLNGTVAKVTATDNDTGINGQITYSIVHGNIRDTFAMDPNTGVITLQYNIDKQVYDPDSHTRINLTVRATDGGILPESSETTVSIFPVGDPQPCSGEAGAQTDQKEAATAEDLKYIISLFVLIAVACLLLVSNSILIILSCKQEPEVTNPPSRTSSIVSKPKKYVTRFQPYGGPFSKTGSSPTSPYVTNLTAELDHTPYHGLAKTGGETFDEIEMEPVVDYDDAAFPRPSHDTSGWEESRFSGPPRGHSERRFSDTSPEPPVDYPSETEEPSDARRNQRYSSPDRDVRRRHTDAPSDWRQMFYDC